MTLQSPAYVISADSHSAALFRQAAQTFIGGTGVVGSGDLAVSQNGTPNMSVNVAPGLVWMPGTLSSSTGFSYLTNNGNQSAYGLPTLFNSQGSYCAYNDGTVNLVISAADPSNPRIDLVCASVQDAQYSGSNNQPVLQVVTGTPAGSPVAPSAPASTVVLAQVLVGAAVTQITNGNITDERPLLQLANTLRAIPAGRVYTTATGSLTSGANPFSTPTLDWLYGGMLQFASTGGLQVPVAGIYEVKVQVQITAPSSGSILQAAIFRNNAVIRAGDTFITTTTSQNFGVTCSSIVKCAATDYLNAGISWSTGSAPSLTANSGSLYNSLSAVLVSM